METIQGHTTNLAEGTVAGFAARMRCQMSACACARMRMCELVSSLMVSRRCF
jgi:hypothetical protein